MVFTKDCTVNRRLWLKELRKERLSPRTWNYSQGKEKQLFLERKVKFVRTAKRVLSSSSCFDCPSGSGTLTTFSHTVLGRTPLDEWSARLRELYLTNTTITEHRHTCTCRRKNSNPQSHQRAAAEQRLRPRGHWDRRRVYFRVITEVILFI